MPNQFHKLTALFLATVVFYNVSGHFLFFLVQQQVIRSVVAEMLHDKDAPLVMLSLTNEEAASYLADDAGEIYFQQADKRMTNIIGKGWIAILPVVNCALAA